MGRGRRRHDKRRNGLDALLKQQHRVQAVEREDAPHWLYRIACQRNAKFSTRFREGQKGVRSNSGSGKAEEGACCHKTFTHGAPPLSATHASCTRPLLSELFASVATAR